MTEVDTESTPVERLEHQLRSLVRRLTPEAVDRVSIDEKDAHVAIALPEPWLNAACELLEPLNLTRKEGGTLVARSDDLWRVVRHMELALPESEQLRRKVEKGKMEPRPGLIRFGSVSRAMPLPHWEELSEEGRSRVKEEQAAAEIHARQWAEELRLIGARSLARFRERLG